jgi:hypothetical protein
MGERWVTLVLLKNETLECDGCAEYIHDEEVHLYVDANDDLIEIMCTACWKKEGEKS